MKLKKGDKAPSFELSSQDNDMVKLSDFKGHKLLIYFYPRALTSGCTIQSVNVRDAGPNFKSLKTAVVGISTDPPATQKKFDDKNSLGFPLLSDQHHETAERYGVWQEKNMYGKKSFGIVRSSFLVDEKGFILEVWYKISPNETVAKAISTLSR
jgi:thioredoxin-dependent peroxiredoxin